MNMGKLSKGTFFANGQVTHITTPLKRERWGAYPKKSE
jgi:hypothetical protein